MANASAPAPKDLVDRFARAFAAFVEAAESAMKDAAQNPEFAGTPEFEAWRDDVMPLLRQKKEAVEKAITEFQAGDARAILVEGEDKRGLAKDMDGYPLTFAGAEHAETLGALRSAVVGSACRLCDAAGIP